MHIHGTLTTPIAPHQLHRFSPFTAHRQVCACVCMCARTNVVDMLPVPTLPIWRETASLQIPIYMTAAPPQSQHAQPKSTNKHVTIVKNKDLEDMWTTRFSITLSEGQLSPWKKKPEVEAFKTANIVKTLAARFVSRSILMESFQVISTLESKI